MGYDLISATSPDPAQEIQLAIDLPGLGLPDETSSPDITSDPRFRVGDTIPVRTGIILDYNGNPVPDNTPVNFTFSVNNVDTPTVISATIGGIAKSSFQIEQPGTIEIRAEAGGAQSFILTTEVPEESTSPTPTSSVTPTEVPTQEPTPTIEEPTPTPVADIQPEPNISGMLDWIMALGISFVMGWVALRAGAVLGQVRWGVRWGLSALIGGLLGYTYAILQLPGTAWIFETPYHWGLFLITLLGSLLGWGIGVITRAIGNSK